MMKEEASNKTTLVALRTDVPATIFSKQVL
jgi:hypothetical protein